MSGASVIILPTVRVERKGEAPRAVLVQATLDPNTYNKLDLLARRYWDGDIGEAAAGLLTHAVEEYSRGGRR